MGVLSAIILVSGIATSTLTQSVVTYPTRNIQLPGNDSALTLKNDGYYWATANTNAMSKHNLGHTLGDVKLTRMRRRHHVPCEPDHPTQSLHSTRRGRALSPSHLPDEQLHMDTIHITCCLCGHEE